jgi:DNA repair protein SbcD/Mre11
VRILHASDWHLGRSFHREDLLTAQGVYVDHLVETVRSECVDVVLVSGDVFDRALPPVDAVTLASEALRRLAAERVRVVISSGNHDSVHRLGFAAELIDAAGIHLRTRASDVGTPVVVEGDDVDVAFYSIPYLEPDAVREPWRLPDRSHAAVLSEAMRRVGHDIRHCGRAMRSVVLAHAFVTGGVASQSERDISVGGVAHVPATVFAGVDYVALGHLHGRQRISEQIRYSGSPLPYSFSEADHRKGSWLVDIGGQGVREVSFVPAPIARRLGSLTGRLEELLRDPALASHEDRWLQVTLTDSRRPKDAMRRLRARFPHALVLAFAPEHGEHATSHVRDRVRGRTDMEIAEAFVADIRGEPVDTDEQSLLRRACDACRVEGVS